MSQYPNSGAMFENDRKRPDKNDPDRNGSGHVTCPHCQKETEYWLNGWIKPGKRGKFLSLSFKPKDATCSKPTSQQSAPPDSQEDNSDIPF